MPVLDTESLEDEEVGQQDDYDDEEDDVDNFTENLSGSWLIAEDRVVELRHWTCCKAVFSIHDEAGAEEFFGWVSTSENGQWIQGEFGQREPVEGEVQHTPTGTQIVWQTDARQVWKRESAESPVPHVASTIGSTRKASAPTCRKICKCLWRIKIGIYLCTTLTILLLWICVAHSLRIDPRWCIVGAVVPTCLGINCLQLGILPLMKGRQTMQQAQCWLNCTVTCAIPFFFLAYWPLRECPGWLQKLFVVSASVFLLCNLLRHAINDCLLKRENESDPLDWPGEHLEELDPEDPEFRRVKKKCDEEAAAYTMDNPLLDNTRITVETVYRVNNDHLRDAFDEARGILVESTDPVELYHGTSVASMKKILQNNFRLPPSTQRMGFNMFGAGIYFADNPKKSWNYSSQSGCPYLLMCDVALGRRKKLDDAATELSAAHMNKQLRLTKEFDAVQGLTKEEGGTLYNPEFIIYNADQSIPKFVVKFKESHPGDLI